MKMITKSIDQAYKTLEVGRVYSYKELCEILKEKPKTGNSKPSQLARWNNYFELEKVSRSDFKVISITDNPPEQVNPYRGKVLECEKEFNENLYYCLFNGVSYCDCRTIFQPYRIITENGENVVCDAYYFDRNELIKTMELYNGDIGYLTAGRDVLINKFTLNLFKRTVIGKAREVFDYRVKKLMEQGIFEYKNCIVYNRAGTETYILPDRYTEIWKECEKEALKKLGFRSIQEILINDRWADYVGTTKRITTERMKEFEHCQKKKLIIFKPEYAEGLQENAYAEPEEQHEKNVAKLKEMMNRLCKERIKKKIARINEEYRKGQKIKEGEDYKETKELLDTMKLINAEETYPELEEPLQKIDDMCRNRIEVNTAKELLKLCDKWVGGIGTEEEKENSELSEEK